MNRDDALLQDWRPRALALETEVKKAVIGQDNVIHHINIAVFARGHVLLEGDVGVGKTTVLRGAGEGLAGKTRILDPGRLASGVSRNHGALRVFQPHL